MQPKIATFGNKLNHLRLMVSGWKLTSCVVILFCLVAIGPLSTISVHCALFQYEP